MQILNVTLLDKKCRKYPDAARWLRTWLATVEQATWGSIQDVRKHYPSADGVVLAKGNVVTVFNVRGNTFRLLTSIRYSTQSVYIIDVLTHAEYNKDHWKG
jgi:mRNA interferase HigB